MRKKKAAKKINFSGIIFGLYVVAFLLIVYLVRATDRLIRIQTANAGGAKQLNLPVVPTGASCGT